MPEVTITVGGKEFTVACQAGEEQYLHTAAAMLDREASALVSQIGRIPEARMLLMAGLMLADRTAAFEERASVAEGEVARQGRMIDELRSMPAPEPRTIEVPVVPPAVLETLAEVAARAEALADQIEEKAAGGGGPGTGGGGGGSGSGYGGGDRGRSGGGSERRVKPAV